MRLDRLTLENFRSYDSLELDLSRITVAAVIGRNGAGKSTIPVAIDWCLFGAGSADELLREGSQRGGVTLEISDGGDRWRIARGRERGRKSWLNIEVAPEGQPWGPINRHSIPDTQAYLNAVLGMTDTAYRASVYSAQGEAGMLAAMNPGERKALLGSLLGLEEYEEWRQQASLDARGLQEQLRSREERMERINAEIVELKHHLDESQDLAARITESEQEVDRLEKELVQANLRVQALEQVRQRHFLVERMQSLKDRALASKALAEERHKLRQRVAETAAVEQEFEAIDAERREYQLRLESERRRRQAALDEAQRLRREYESKRQARERAEAVLERVDKRRSDAMAVLNDFIQDPDPQCPMCAQGVADEARTRTHEQLQTATEKATEDLRQAGQDVADAKAAEAEAMRAATLKKEEADAILAPDDTGFEKEQTWNQLAAARREHQQLVGRLDGMAEPEDVAVLRRQWQEAKEQAEKLPSEVPSGPDAAKVTSDLRQAQVVLRELSAKQERRSEWDARLGRATDEVRSMRQEVGEIKGRAEALELLATAYSRSGIPAMILDNAVGGIEVATNRVLEQLESTLRIRLVTQRAKKSGKGMTETLEVMVDDGVHERALRTYSGGERYRVHVALRLGLADALGAASGRNLEFLLIDEPTDLDGPGVALLADLLAKVDRQVLLVTHQGELVDAMPQRVVVERASDASPSAVTLR